MGPDLMGGEQRAMIMRRSRTTRYGVVLVIMMWTAVACAGETQSGDSGQVARHDPPRYLRVRRDEAGEPVALETAVTRFRGERGAGEAVVVDLVGVIHIGEKAYYERLNEMFASYDAVLYELVAPEGARAVPSERRGTTALHFLQNAMKNVLKLEFQLDHIDYAAPNMVHADMSPAEFSESMKARGESFFKMVMRMMRHAVTAQAEQQDVPSDMELLFALLANDRAYRLKRVMAEQFEHMERQLLAFNGPDGSTIITERNKKALRVLRDQLKRGERRLAIFYGAGHLPDMAERLEKDFGLKTDGQQWLVAWRITAPLQEEPGAATELKAQPAAAESSE